MKIDGAELRDPKAKLRIRFRDQERLVGEVHMIG